MNISLPIVHASKAYIHARETGEVLTKHLFDTDVVHCCLQSTNPLRCTSPHLTLLILTVIIHTFHSGRSSKLLQFH